MAQSNAQAVSTTSAFGPLRLEGAEPSRHGDFDVAGIEGLPVREVPLAALSLGGALRQAGTDPAHVRLLAEASESAELPPILVQVDGCHVIDGLHRVEAAGLLGEDTIRARFLHCSNSDALLIAMRANGSHGLPLSRADRVAGARRVLASHPDWSDRAIAGATGLSAKTVASLRDRSACPTPLDGKRVGQDGRRRPVDAGEGRRRAAAYIAAHPDAPLRQVARAADVSLGTVHDVSARLRRGEGPERDGQRPQAARPQLMRSVPPGEAAGAVEAASELPGRAPLRVAGSAESAPPQRRNHTDAAPTWAAVAAKLATDPAIRYTAGGREFLRWMQSHAAEPGEDWRRFIDAVPPHWLSVVAPIAENIGKEWCLLAERLKARHDLCGGPARSGS